MESSIVLINQDMTLPPRNVAGHEAFHYWKNRQARQEYVETFGDFGAEGLRSR